MARLYRSAPVLALVLAALSCSREASQPAPRGEGTMKPASGEEVPGSRVVRSPCSQRFMTLDADGSGSVSIEEFSVQPGEATDPLDAFRERDRDADGRLDESEFCSEQRQGDDQAPAPPGGPANGVREGLGGMPMGVPCEEHFATFDQDRDTRLTRDEFEAFPHVEGDQETTFNERDVDHDGSLSRVEFCAPWQ